MGVGGEGTSTAARAGGDSNGRGGQTPFAIDDWSYGGDA